MSMKIKAGIVGGAGYTGGEVLRLLLNHPNVEIVAVQSTSNSGKQIIDVHSDLIGDTDMSFVDTLPLDVDVLFLCMGHGKSRAFLSENNVRAKIIDLGNDFRLHRDSDFGGRHFVYGLRDFFASEIEKADSIANPGCFATALQMALLPLAKASLLVGDVNITAITGSTGAGQALSAGTHFSLRENNISTYKNFTHQHLSEIIESIKRLQPSFCDELNFIPYKGDFTRGIFATLHTVYNGDIETVKNIYKNYYLNSPFVHITDDEVYLKQVVNTNKCILKIEQHGKHLMITSVIDNLLKGAAGQAVENMNLMFKLDPKAGLRLKPSAF